MNMSECCSAEVVDAACPQCLGTGGGVDTDPCDICEGTGDWPGHVECVDCGELIQL